MKQEVFVKFPSVGCDLHLSDTLQLNLTMPAAAANGLG